MAPSSVATAPTRAEPAGRPVPGARWVAGIAAAALLAHLAVALWGPYELHRDALLYLAMGEHLELFRMDAPPFIALLAEATRALLGDSLPAIRTGPALAHTALILLAGAFARLAGGGARAQALAALAVAAGPVFLRTGSLFQPVAFDQLWWTLALYALARIGVATAAVGDTGPDTTAAASTGPLARARHDPRRWWILLGVTLGVGLLTKFTVLVLGAGILAGLAATPLRRSLLTPWPWLAAGLAFLIGSPSLIGQVALGWPFFGQFEDLQAVQLSRVSPVAFAAEQLLLAGPIVLLGVAGAVALVTAAAYRPLRPVGWAAIVAFLLMMAAGGKSYYIAPIWPALIAVGLAGLERWANRLRGRSPRPRRSRLATGGVWALATAMVVGYGVVALPLGLPFLPPEPMARYAAGLGMTQATTTNWGEVLELPQDYADMLGWRALAAEVTAVWDALPQEDRAVGVILATNYGRAGAIDFYGPDHLPPVVAPVGSYWFWGPGDRPGEVVVLVGVERDEALAYFRSADVARRVARPWGVPEERDVPIVVARNPIRPLAQLWPEWAGVN